MSICQVGGAEQYIYNKCKFLKANGYKVHVFSGLKRKIVVPGLRKYQKECLPCVMFLPSTFTDKEVYKNVELMLKNIDFKDGDEVIIESNGIAEALWGELLAKRLKCKNLYIDINEFFNFDIEKKKYARFKMKRKELFGITSSSVSAMLNDDITINYSEHINASCINVVDDCKYERLNEIVFDDHYTIGYLGRIAKDCVPVIVDELCKYIHNNPKTDYNIIFIGTKDRENVSYIETRLNEYKNVTVHFTDSMYPVSRELIHKVDVFVSTAGSAFVTYFDGIPTVIVHPVQGYAVGIMGEDFFVGDDMYRSACEYTIAEEINRIRRKEAKILFDENYLKNYNNDMIIEFKRQMRFVDKASPKKRYYPYKQVKGTSKKERIYTVLGKLIGSNALFKLLEVYRRNKTIN